MAATLLSLPHKRSLRNFSPLDSLRGKEMRPTDRGKATRSSTRSISRCYRGAWNSENCARIKSPIVAKYLRFTAKMLTFIRDDYGKPTLIS